MSRALLGLVLIGSVTFAAAPAGPLPSQIALWIEQLGDDDFMVRQTAARLLRAAGERAEAALAKAVDSPDAEVRRLARPILADFQAGLYPDVPPRVAELIGRYRTVAGSEKPPIIHELLSSGSAGTRALLKLARNEKDALVRKETFGAIGLTLARSAVKLLDAGDRSTLETLLDLAVEGDLKKSAGHYAAYHLLNGSLKAKIADYQARAKAHPPGKPEHEMLVYLHRAAGNYAAARESALAAERNDFLEGILYEQADWKELDRREFSSHDEWVVGRGYRAAYARLAGNTKVAERTLAEIIEKARPLARAKQDVLLYVKALIFNGKTTDALTLLAESTKENRMLFECYVAQMRYKEAFALADDAERNDRPDKWMLRLLEARIRHSLGKTEQARKILGAAAAEIKPGTNLTFIPQLIEAAVALDRRDEAFKLFGDYFTATKDDTHTNDVLRSFFPDEHDDASVVWFTLRNDDFKGTPIEKLALLRKLFEGKATAAELAELIKTLRDRPLDGPNQESRMRALGEACVLCKQEKLATRCFSDGGTRGAVRWGDLLRADKKYPRALDAYLAAYKLAQDSMSAEDDREGEGLPSLALFLAGQTLKDLGRHKEAQEHIDRAHLLLMGDIRKRLAFLRILRDRDYEADALREARTLSRLGEPIPTDDDNYYTMEGVRNLALAAERKNRAQEAADGFEQVFLGCLQPGVNFTRNPQAYVTVSSLVFRQRALAEAQAGRFDESVRLARASLGAWPANLDTTLRLYPVLAKAGRTKDAEALFDDTLAAQLAPLKDFPESGLLLNQAAWLAGCCKRDLDKAARWAKQAVEVAPKTAAYQDTLAEVLFQQGKQAEAVAAQKKAISLDPKRKYFKIQLKRIEAGDRNAPLPIDD